MASLLRTQAASVLACDFLTVETGFLQRIYVLLFMSLATRRIEHVACSSNPDGGWVTEQARNLIMRFGEEQPFRFLVHDRDRKFSRVLDEVFRGHPGDPHTDQGPERQRSRRALGAYAPR
jgi:hypothetical protein